MNAKKKIVKMNFTNAMHINIHNDSLKFAFLDGSAVTKIVATNTLTGISRQINMVITKEDYTIKLKTHNYTPLLYSVNLYARLGYLYDCLNRVYDAKRSDEFKFYVRHLNQRVWSEWFTIKPYADSSVADL